MKQQPQVIQIILTLDTQQTIDIRWLLPFSIVFIIFLQTAENDMKTMCIVHSLGYVIVFYST